MEPIGLTILPLALPALNLDKKKFRFNDQVEHRLTFGKSLDDDRYQVLFKQTVISLVDEDFDRSDIFTKDEINQLEQRYKHMSELIKVGYPISDEIRADMNKTSDFFIYLNGLFEGHEELPDSLPKSVSHIPVRENRAQSAGTITNTLGKTTIGKMNNSSSWRIDDYINSQLKRLHQEAVEILVQTMQWPSTKDVRKQMYKLRPWNRKITFTENDLCGLYLDQCRAKERLMNSAIKEKVSELKSVQEKQDCLNRYHTINWIPCNSTNGVADIEFLKKSLEGILDIVFDKGTMDARYSDISKADVKEFIRFKYQF